MRNADPDTFHFFMPLSIQKGGQSVDDEGQPIMRIGGIASTNSQDADGEFLSPEGFDLSRLLKGGYFNWQHQTNSNPASIVGYPDVARITPEGLYVEGPLYPQSAMARQIYELQSVLEKAGGSRSLGFSIEGKATLRDPRNPQRVLKAMLTGIAITPTPKNTDTIMSILKGEGSGLVPEFDEDVEGMLLKAVSPDGDVATLSASGEITICKGAEGAPLANEEKFSSKNSPEDLHNTEQGGRFGTFLNKSEVYAHLIPWVNSPAEARSLYTLIGSMHNVNMAELDKDLIQKALENVATLGTLDISALTKGAVSTAMGADAHEPNLPGDGTTQLNLLDGLQKSETELALEQAEATAQELRAKVELEKAEKPTITDTTQSQGISAGVLEKGLAAFGEALMGQLSPQFNSVGELSKALVARHDSIQKDLSSLLERVKRIEDAPVGSKTVLSKSYQDNDLGSRAEPPGNQQGSRTLSISNRDQKAELVKAVSPAIGFGTDRFDSDLSKAVARFEATGDLSESILQVAKDKNIRVIQ